MTDQKKFLEQGVTKVMEIGIRMGAYNALVLGQKMPLTQIICFTPQFSVHLEVLPEGMRWRWFRKQIIDWPHKQMDKLPKLPAPIYMFHGNTPDERMHWERFPMAPNLRRCIFKGVNTVRKFARQLTNATSLMASRSASLTHSPNTSILRSL